MFSEQGSKQKFTNVQFVATTGKNKTSRQCKDAIAALGYDPSHTLCGNKNVTTVSTKQALII